MKIPSKHDISNEKSFLASGEQCGDVHCLKDEASCVNHRGVDLCRCDAADKKGDGSLACFRKDCFYGMIRSEPFVHTYDRITYQLNLPCRFLATKFTSRLKTKYHEPGDRVGVCECDVFSWQRKQKGKFYPHGFDASCQIARTDSAIHNVTGFSIRKYGVGRDGNYDVVIESVDEYRPNGPWLNQSITVNNHGIVTECQYDFENNRAVIDARSCGLEVQFRPFDIKKGRWQDQPNGVSFALCEDHVPHLTDNGRTIISGPRLWYGVPLPEQMEMENSTLLTHEEFMLFRALTSGVEQNQPDASEECGKLHHSALVCDTEAAKKTAMDECKWMLHSQPFIKCVDPHDNGDTILHLVRRCFDQACGTLPCSEFLYDLKALPYKCIGQEMSAKSAKLNKWLNYEFCEHIGPMR